MASLCQVRFKHIAKQRHYLYSYKYLLSIQQKYHIHPNHFCVRQPYYRLEWKQFSTKPKDTINDATFEFGDDYDDFDSYQKRKGKETETETEIEDTTNYYHQYFTNKDTKSATDEENLNRKRLKKPRGPRMTEKDKKEEAETKRLSIEYRIIGTVILAFSALVGYYVYYVAGSKIGKADTYYLTAIDYQLKCDLDHTDDKQRAELIKKTDYYFKKALEFTNFSYPKYLHKYAEFLLFQKKDYMAAEHYITKALGLHKTNAIYHKFYCILLRSMIEDNANVERLNDYHSQKFHTIQAHIQEAAYFLSEENNEKAAIMHCDYALNFCDASIKQNTEENDTETSVFAINEDAEDMKSLKTATYSNVAELLQEYGFNESAERYWKEGIKEFGEPVDVRYGVFCYKQQRFDEALDIFNKYASGENKAALVFIARIFMEMGQYKKALDIYSSILPQIGMDPMVIGDMIYILIETNKINDARNLMKQVIVLLKKQNKNDDLMSDPNNNYINMLNILLLGRMDDIETANYQCLEMVNNYANDFEVNYLAALYYHKYAKNYDKADRFYRAAISIEDQWAKTYYHYSLLFKQNNDMAQFIKYIKIAYNKNPNIPMIDKLYHQYYDDEGRVLPRALQ